MQACANIYYHLGNFPAALALLRRIETRQAKDPRISAETLYKELKDQASLLRDMNYIAEARELESKANKLQAQLISSEK